MHFTGFEAVDRNLNKLCALQSLLLQNIQFSTISQIFSIKYLFLNHELKCVDPGAYEPPWREGACN